MNETIIYGYDPRCKIYEREQTAGRKSWYIKYYLPNGKMMRRPCGKTISVAKVRMHTKEKQLLMGEFDEKDLRHLEGFSSRFAKPLSIDEAVELYLTSASTGKTAKTRYNDKTSITKHFSFFKKLGQKHIKDVTPLDVQRLIDFLDGEGKSKSTVVNSAAFVKKVFNWLINIAKVPNLENPVVKGLVFPKKGKLVRGRVPTLEEVNLLLKECLYPDKKPSSSTPIRKVIPFLILTGARLGEALHAEWDDFDLENNIWSIREKENCPTSDGLGWDSKWRVERDVPLFPEVKLFLESIKREQTIGYVPIIEDGKKTGKLAIPANLVFPKKEVRRLSSGEVSIVFSRIDSIKKSWKTLTKNAGVTDLQVKDLRPFFNSLLSSKYGFSSKESGSFIGNSEAVNDKHYNFAQLSFIRDKMNQHSISDVLGVKLSG